MIEESRMRFISGMLNHTIERQRTLTINDTVYKKIVAPVLFSPLSPSLSVGELKTG